MCVFISGRRKILYSLYIQFGIFMKIVGITKMQVMIFRFTKLKYTTMKIEAVGSSETLVTAYENA
jgi:hypothetical protein